MVSRGVALRRASGTEGGANHHLKGGEGQGRGKESLQPVFGPGEGPSEHLPSAAQRVPDSHLPARSPPEARGLDSLPTPLWYLHQQLDLDQLLLLPGPDLDP
ncbi:hypothetical protein CB1_000875019 [Camelus ferus]|nr:hypothetical protein CB1_000875019 [Camelus ferus]